MTRPLALIAVLLATLLLACGGDDDDSGVGSGTTEPAAVFTSTPEVTATTAEGRNTPEPAPVGVTDEPVRFETSDGATIAGHLYSDGGGKRKVVVLAHEFPKDQTAWTEFARQLAGMGIAALTFDFRGYGETGGDFNVATLDLDVEAAARFVASRDYPEVYLYGASMGGTASIKVAARLDVAGLVTVSSPAVLPDFDALPDMANVAEPKLFIAGSGDADGLYVTVIDQFLAAAPDPKASVILEESAHGTDLFDTPSGAELETLLLTFLEEN